MNILTYSHPSLFRRLLLLAGMAVFSACSVDELPDGAPDGGNASDTYSLAITVNDGGYTPSPGTSTRTPGTSAHMSGTSTRAAETQYATAFTAGDAIGVYAIDESGKILPKAMNLCLVAAEAASGGGLTWQTTDGKTPRFVPGGTYYAYYPYRADDYMANKVPDTTDSPLVASTTTAADFFKDLITAWSPATNQGTYADYTAQDLMIAKGTLAGEKLSFNMAHQMALVVIDLPNAKYTLSTDASYTWTVAAKDPVFSDFTPYRMDDGTYRYLILPTSADVADAAKPVLSGSYTRNNSSVAGWSFNADAATGACKKYAVDGGTTVQTHELKVGDFYLKDGSLIATGTTLSAAQQADCIGIVFCTDKTRIGNGETEKLSKVGVNSPHGLVMALKNASYGFCCWGVESRDENENGQKGEPFTEEPNPVCQVYRHISGYAETHWMGAKIADPTDESHTIDTYKAFYVALNYGKGATARYAAPEKTTGWFLPSMGQWWDLLVNLGKKENLSSYQDSNADALETTGSNTVISNLNTHLLKVSGANLFSPNSLFCTSTEGLDSQGRWAWICCFYQKGDLILKKTNKAKPSYRVRTVLAF